MMKIKETTTNTQIGVKMQTPMRALVWALILTLAIPCPAAFADNWFDKFTDDLVVHDSSAWESQQRGYFAAGGVSYRTKTNREPIFSITSPKMQIGCGGIDSFWGGFSYLNPEYLVKMFQNILQAAPAFAFKLALSSLCTQCDDAMSSLNSLANSLNSLSMDECKASQALTNFGGDAIADMLGMDNPRGENKENSWLTQSLGMLTKASNDLKSKIDDVLEYQYCYGITNHDDLDKCKSYLKLEGSLWDKVLKKEQDSDPDPVDSTFIALVRGMFGDLIFIPGGQSDGSSDSSTSTGSVTFVAPCETPARSYLDAMLASDQANATSNLKVGFRYSYSDPTSQKECVDEQLPSVMRVGIKAKNGIQNLVDLMKTDPTGELTQDAKDVIGQSSLPLYQIINTYAYRVRENGGAFISDKEKDTLVKMAALGHALFILNSVVDKAYQLVAKHRQGLMLARGVQPMAKDQFDAGFAHLSANISDFKGQLYKIDEEYIGEFQKNMQAMVAYQNLKMKMMELVRNKGLI